MKTLHMVGSSVTTGLTRWPGRAQQSVRARHGMQLAALLLVAVVGAGGSKALADPVWDWVPPHGQIVFWWTLKGSAMTDPEARENNTDQGVWENFGEPPVNDQGEKATDWRQYTIDKDGKKSDVMAGNIAGGRGWEFRPLEDLPSVPWQIPDLISTEPGVTEIYAAVNLGLYLASNPWPDLTPGQSVTVTNGRMAGLEGIYWSWTQFSFDPNSATGFVGDPYTGTAFVQNFHTDVPEPASLALLALGGVAALRRRMA